MSIFSYKPHIRPALAEYLALYFIVRADNYKASV